MDDDNIPSGRSAPRRADLLLRAAYRAAAASRAATSPSAVEATLASVSDEVMEEAIARRARAAGSNDAKGTKGS